MRVHFLGIGGSGASAAAAIAQAEGFEVTGCDLEPDNEFTTKFKDSQLSKAHNPKHLYSHSSSGKVDILAVTPAIFSLDPQNPELVEAKKLGIPVFTWQQFVGEYLTKDKFVIAVAGTHGKTTTTAMIAQILEEANLDPTVLLGAIHPKWGANYRLNRQTTNGRWYFVIEADEFNDNFLAITPDISVVTNIEMDHPEYFKDFAAVKRSFKKFLNSTRGTIVANLSDPGVRDVITSTSTSLSVNSAKQSTTSNKIASSPSAPRNDRVVDYSKHSIDFPLQIPGEFNRLNASAAYQVVLLLGVQPLSVKQSLQNYHGVGRRFEYVGDFHGARVYSDFGHHPTEIKVTMEAARQKFPNQRIILIYEPHMFSRTKVFFDDFVKVFKEIPVDKIIITDIYPSREVDTGLVTSQQLVHAAHYDTLVYHSKDQLLHMLKDHVRKNDIIFFMGAGDIDKIARGFVTSAN